jgi:hypothetical protein
MWSSSNLKREPGIRLFWAILIAWAVSFILPAAKSKSFPDGYPETRYGFEMALTSIVFAWVPYFGQLWIVNVFVALAPAFIKRVKQGNGRTYLFLLVTLALLPSPLLFTKKVPLLFDRFEYWLAGFYLWQAAALGMAGWYFLFARGYWRDLSEKRELGAMKPERLSAWTPWRQ